MYPDGIEVGTLLDEFEVPTDGPLLEGRADDELPLIHSACGVRVANVEPGDVLGILARVAADHLPECPAAPSGVQPYTMCALCPHFIEPNDDAPAWADAFLHLDDGEQEDYDHGAKPGAVRSLGAWRLAWPELFRTYPDGKIGPNSAFFDGYAIIDNVTGTPVRAGVTHKFAVSMARGLNLSSPGGRYGVGPRPLGQ